MPNPHTAESPGQFSIPNAARNVELSRADLPLHCPQPGTSLWNSHPRVFLPIEEQPDGRILCPYCSTEYILKSGK
jgi:uncharacterized Zn-finger protein